MLWTLNLCSLNNTMSIASVQSNCNIVGVEHKDGYYFFGPYSIDYSIPKGVLITGEDWLSVQGWF